MLVDHGPDDLAVGDGDGEVIEFGEFVPDEFALVHVTVDDLDGDHDAVVEQEPVCLALEGGFCDEPDQADVVDIDMNSRFLGDFSLSALGRGFSEVHLKLSTNWGAEPLVGFFDAVEKEDPSILVAEIAQTREFVGQRAVGGVFGQSGQDVGGVAHGQR